MRFCFECEDLGGITVYSYDGNIHVFSSRYLNPGYDLCRTDYRRGVLGGVAVYVELVLILAVLLLRIPNPRATPRNPGVSVCLGDVVRC